MLTRWRRRRALRAFLTRLPRDLVARYGRADHYTRGQLRRTLEEGRYPRGFLGYAQVLFLSQADALEEIGLESVYDAIRQELADGYFGGDRNFTAVPVHRREIGNAAHSSLGITQEGSVSND